MKLIFNDSQHLDVQNVKKIGGSISVNIIKTQYKTLKKLFTDSIATVKMRLNDDRVYKNYTVFSLIKEKCGAIFTVEMIQEGKDTQTILWNDCRNGGVNMAVVYATLIVKGKKTYLQVSEKLKKDVKQLLIDIVCGELAE